MNDKATLASTIVAVLSAKKASLAHVREILLAAPADLPQEALLQSLDIAKAAINGSLAQASERIQKGLALGIVPIPINSGEYPPSLRSIADAPIILYARGNLDALQLCPGIAVVGTRKATPHGITIAERIATYMGNHGLPIISGLAMGIDAAAHEGALLSASPTIAVLAHGLEKASPRTNSQLADRILNKGGAWVSEHPCGVPARPEFFVHRNRIQIGLSSASVIVEGALKSGSMTQAEYCIRNKRLLATVLPEPGGMTSTQHALPQMLANDRGAFVIRSKDDYPELLKQIKAHPTQV